MSETSAHELTMQIVAILDELDPELRLRHLGTVLELQFGVLLSYDSIADRDADVDMLFDHVRKRLADSDRRRDGQALH